MPPTRCNFQEHSAVASVASPETFMSRALEVSNSQPLTASPKARPASRPTFGVASGGEDCARRAEDVREIAGKTFHLPLRCLPTAEERCVAGSTSALPPRRSSHRGNRGVREGSDGALRQRRRGAMTASHEAGGRAAGSGGSGCRSGSRASAPLDSACRSLVPRRGYLFE